MTDVKKEQDVMTNGSGEPLGSTLPRERGERESVSNKDDLYSLVDLLVDEAKREAQIIARIREAVERGDKDEVFNLAKELVGS